MRERPVARIKSVIENAIAANKNAEVTIIAHSFGTWMVSRILHDDTNIAIDRLILCGAIVPSDFRWDRVLKINLGGRKNAIVNEYSPLDVWPLTAKVMTYGYGNCRLSRHRRFGDCRSPPLDSAFRAISTSSSQENSGTRSSSRAKSSMPTPSQ